jgi:gamma-glutamyl-gamma-aminobutyrate hydrolase PuuD/predicted ATP-grasp superfamily ATP-dependent carboligase
VSSLFSPSAAAPGRVILTYGRSLMALVIARSLARRGIEVIGCDDVAMTVLSFSRHVKETFTVAPWESQPEAFLDDLEAMVRLYAPRDDRPYVLMPVFRDVELIARHRDRFEPLIRVSAPDVRSFELVHPKDRLARLIEQADIPAPKSFSPRAPDELEAFDVPLPAVVKPVEGVGGRGVSVAETREALLAAASAIGFDPPPLIQAYAPGDDYCVAVLADQGRITAIMAYRNLSTFPKKAGAGAVRESVDPEPFRASVAALMERTGWTGVAEIDFRWTGDDGDTPQLIEVNPRFWAGIFHSIETGVDFPWLLYSQTIGLPFPEPEPQAGTVTRSTGVWLFATLEEVTASHPHLNAAADAWRRAKANLSTGKLAGAMEDAVRALGATASSRDIWEAASTAIAQHRGAPTELSSDKDPLVALGALFVFSHLVRHGELPPEVTYRATSGKASKKPVRPRRRPRIGITKPTRGDTASWWAMRLAVWLAGGEPVKLTAGAPGDPRTIDGLVFGGGSDVYPVLFDQAPKSGYSYDLPRADMETSWAETARRQDLPVLGVCRGAQMLNVFAGGTLHMDLGGYERPITAVGPLQSLFVRKWIGIRPDSRLARWLGTDRLRVNAIHKQAIDRVGAGLRVTAREPNGIVQAIEDPARRFWIGVQFHPELLLYRRPFRALFRGLVEAARTRAAERHAADEA